MFYLLLATNNMTDYLIDLFGWDMMQQLWAPLDYLFQCIESIFSLDLGPLWDMLFT